MNKNMIIKVCGMRDADNIREVENLLILNSKFSINWMGFIFWPKSSRYVSEMPAYLPTKCKRVGVFVDASIGDVMTIAEQYQLDLIQLHGQESPSYIAQLTSHLLTLSPSWTSQAAKPSAHPLKIIKALNIATEADLEATKRYEGYVDYFLFDTKGKSVGGNGEKFDWSVLSAYTGNTPFLLSGGIAPDDAETLNSKFFSLNSKCIGIDLNSKFELSPALKDINKLQEFIKELSI